MPTFRSNLRWPSPGAKAKTALSPPSPCGQGSFGTTPPTVTAQDCVALLKRWQARDSMGQKLADFLKEYSIIDERTFAIVVKERFGPLLQAIGKPSVVVPFMMPKQVAETDTR